MMRAQEVSIRDLRPDELLVRIAAAGICHTDSIIHHQHFPSKKPIVLGHEGAGMVVEVGADVTEVAQGDHVCLTYMSCGGCANCGDHAPYYCERFVPANFLGRRLDGTSALVGNDGAAIGGHFFGQSSFAEFSVANRRNVIRIDADVPAEIAAPLGCGIQTGAGAVLNALRAGPGAHLAVVGTGAVGLSAIMAARVAGAADIVAVDTNPDRLKLAGELGATRLLDDVAQLAGVTAAIDTTGNPSVVKAIALALPARATLILLGAAPIGTELRFDLIDTLNKGLTIKAVIEGESDPRHVIPYLLTLWREGRFPIERLVSSYSFDRIDAAFADHQAGRAVKPVCVWT